MTKSKKLSLAALICGIVSIVGGIIPTVNNVTFILAIAAIVLSNMTGKETDATAEELKHAKIGKILGIVGIVVWVVAFLIVGLIVGVSMI